MKRRDLLFTAGIIAVLAILYLLSMTGKKPTAIPPDQVHMAATTEAACMECHAEGKSNPLKKGHPPKEQCFECHRMKAGGQGVKR